MAKYPSQSFYTDSQLLCSSWLPACSSFALGFENGGIAFYQVGSDQPSSIYTEDGILANLDYECGNGLFDTAMQQPYQFSLEISPIGYLQSVIIARQSGLYTTTMKVTIM